MYLTTNFKVSVHELLEREVQEEEEEQNDLSGQGCDRGQGSSRRARGSVRTGRRGRRSGTRGRGRARRGTQRERTTAPSSCVILTEGDRERGNQQTVVLKLCT